MLLSRLAHPVWWEDVIPGAIQASPNVLVRVLAFPVLPHLALSL